MGGAAPTPSGKGGKKAVDAYINLVPFIDLLSCCISFLLITAVWTQLARMDVQQKSPGVQGAVDEKPPENQVNLTVFVDKDGYIFAKSNGESTNIAVKADDTIIYDKIIHTIDVALTAKFPDIALSDKGQGG